MPGTFFITTAIDYTNGAPHIGHAYEKILADVIARYRRLKGEEVFFLTGVDQHGQKVQQSAEKQGVAPQQFVDDITAKFVALWEKLDVRYDRWAATTDPLHKECVRANLQKLWDDKDPATGESRWIYKMTQRGFYSVRQEQFLTDKERGEDGEFGPEWQPVEEREEENFYFRLKEHKQWLLDFIEKRSADGKPFVIPDFRVAELRNAVEKLEGDLCISRPASRLKWGIPFPETFGAGFVTYVWFDALVNYISFVPGHDPNFGERVAQEKAPGTLSFADWWPPLHVIGKDILIPAHGVYWPVMLKALGFADAEMPTLLVHGWWNIGGAKMSKSLGNSIDPDALADKYGAEALRYYLMRDINVGQDADFDEIRLREERYHGELANKIGNLLNRTIGMAQKYRPDGLTRTWSSIQVEGRPYPEEANEVIDTYKKCFDGSKDPVLVVQSGTFRAWRPLPPYSVHSAIAVVLNFTDVANQLVADAEPWVLFKREKGGDAEAREDLSGALYVLTESLRFIAILISPVLPKAAHGIFDQLQWKLDNAGNESRFSLADATWGLLPDGHVVGKPVPLFPRIENVAAAE